MKKKKTQKYGIVAIVLALALVAVIATKGVVAGASLKQLIAQSAGQTLGQSLALSLAQDVGEEVADDVLGGSVENVEVAFDNGLKTKYVKWQDSDSELFVEEWTEFVPFTSSSSSLAWLQKYDGRVEVQVEPVLWGTASATQKLASGTSTIAQAPQFDADLTANSVVPQGLIPVHIVATGTPFRDVVLSSSQTWNTVFQAGVKASSTWAPVGQNIYVTAFHTTGGSNALQGSSATSTAGSGLMLDVSGLLIHVKRTATTTRAGY